MTQTLEKNCVSLKSYELIVYMIDILNRIDNFLQESLIVEDNYCGITMVSDAKMYMTRIHLISVMFLTFIIHIEIWMSYQTGYENTVS